MRNYKQLSQAQRYQIEILNKAGKNQKEIAELLGVSPTTICREFKRNKGHLGYSVFWDLGHEYGMSYGILATGNE